MSESLEIGSGYAPAENITVHMDINPACPHLEHVGPADELPAEWTNRFAYVRAADVLEHFSYQQTERVLAEWFRVTAPGGKIYVQVPDARRIIQQWHAGRLPTPIELPPNHHIDMRLSFWLLGGHTDGSRAKVGDDWRWNAHYTLFTEPLLRGALATAGFKNIRITPLNLNMACWGEKP